MSRQDVIHITLLIKFCLFVTTVNCLDNGSDCIGTIFNILCIWSTPSDLNSLSLCIHIGPTPTVDWDLSNLISSTELDKLVSR